MVTPDFSRYRNPAEALRFNQHWADQLQALNGLPYQRLTLATDWGSTVVWVHTPKRRFAETLVFFSGFHSPALAWDINHNLAPLKKNYRLCLVEINGQPGLSAGHSPALETDAYGRWALEVLQQLSPGRVSLLGHGLGGFICLKTCRLAPDRIKQAILVNPAGLQALSPSFALLRYYWLALHRPGYEAVQTFLRQSILSGSAPGLPPAYEKLVVDYQVYALSEFTPASWWHPALPSDELSGLTTQLHLLVGAQDKLYPYGATLERASECLPSVASLILLPRMGHGIQGVGQAIPMIQSLLGSTSR
ncbi:alpha/beta fold hydrolase [Spirosoma pulveris]